MLHLDHVEKHFGTAPVLTDISGQLQAGSVVGLVGANGAGKSTLMRCIAGLVRPTAGRIEFGGRAIDRDSAGSAVIGTVLGGFVAHPSVRVGAAIRIHGTALGVPESVQAAALPGVGLGGTERRRIRELSLGMRQRLAIACALLGSPRLLLLDEPMNGLDPDGVIWVRQIVAHLAASGVLVIMSSHLLGELEFVADHVLGLRSGRVVLDGSLADLRRQMAVTSALQTSDDRYAAQLLREHGLTCEAGHGDGLRVSGDFTNRQLGEFLYWRGIRVYELASINQSLEAVYLSVLGSGSSEKVA